MDNNQVQVQAGKSAYLKSWVIGGVAAGSTALMTLPAHAAITIPTEISDVFTDLATAFGTLMAAGAVLFGVIRGGIALFKLASRVFSAAGA